MELRVVSRRTSKEPAIYRIGDLRRVTYLNLDELLNDGVVGLLEGQITEKGLNLLNGGRELIQTVVNVLEENAFFVVRGLHKTGLRLSP